MTNQLPIVAIDFFCGAGGMTSGLVRAGIHVLAGIDNQPLCEATYSQNVNGDGSHPAYLCKDIFPKTRTYPGGQQSEIADEIHNLIGEFKKRVGCQEVKLVFAICAPCQPFTKITKIKMSESRQYKRDNDTNLLLTTTKLIGRFRPDAIICENVEGIVGDDKNSVLGKFKRSLYSYGYTFNAKIVNASRFGVPQNRWRTIGIGYYKKRYNIVVDIPEADKSFGGCVSVAQTIGHLPAIAAGEVHPKVPNHRARCLSPLNLKRISCALPGSDNSYLKATPYGDLSLDCHKRLVEKWGEPSFSDTYTRMRADNVAPTITTKFVSITNGRFGHYDTQQNRALTPREAALLQTFDENYVFYPEDNLTFTATLIGNAVPPKLAEFFGLQIIKALRQVTMPMHCGFVEDVPILATP